MASHSEPVSVPAVKPEPTPTTNPPETAPALATAPVSAGAAAGWLHNKTKVGIVLGGTVLTLVGGAFGVKSIGSGTPKVVAQNPDNKSQFITPASPAPKQEPDLEPRKLPNEIDDIPPVREAPKVRPVATVPPAPRPDPTKIALDIDLPDMKAPPIPAGNKDLVIDSPDVKVPPKPVIHGAPKEVEAPLSTVHKTGTVKQDDMPILRVGAAETKDKTETAPPPKAPIIDLDVPPLVSPPKLGGAPAPAPAPLKTDFDIPPPPVAPVTPPVAPPVAPVTPPVAPMVLPTGPAPMPAPKNLDVPPPPVVPGIKDELPGVSPPTISVPPNPKPPVNPDPRAISPPDLIPTPAPAPAGGVGEPRIKPPGIDVPTGPAPVNLEPTPMVGGTPKPPADAPKREEYDEDWHTPKAGDDYAMISKEYYKTGDYAQALEAYNKDRRKGNENIIRVPPLWVLEEKFPTMTGAGKTDPRPAPGAPGKTTGLSFEPVEGKQIGSSSPGVSRPAPPPAPVTPASNVNDEYRVQAGAGETIREIARKLYGDPNAWKRIWEMNPAVDPTQPIPAGTTLRLPRS